MNQVSNSRDERNFYREDGEDGRWMCSTCKSEVFGGICDCNTQPSVVEDSELRDNLKFNILVPLVTALEPTAKAAAIFRGRPYEDSVVYESILDRLERLIAHRERKAAIEARIRETKENREACWYVFDPNGEGEESADQLEIDELFTKRLKDLEILKEALNGETSR